MIRQNNIAFSRAVGLGIPQRIEGTIIQNTDVQILNYEASSKINLNDGGQMRNNLPQVLAKIALESPTHGAAIQRKSFMIQGLGIDNQLLSKEAAFFCEEMLNEYGETLNDLHAKIAYDYALFGGYAIEAIWGNNGKIVALNHIPFSQVRREKPSKASKGRFVISNNWGGNTPFDAVETRVLNKFDPNVFKDGIPKENGVPTPTEIQAENASQIIYKFDYTPSPSESMTLYPIPQYWCGIDAALTETSIGIANKSLIDNGFNGKYIITVPYLPSTQEEQRELDAALVRNYSGPQNHGELMTLYVGGQDQMPKIDKLEPIEADTYLNVDAATKQSIISAHQIPAILLEYAYGGGFNSRGEEMKQAFEQYQATKIKQLQLNLQKTYKTLLFYAGFDNENVQIIPFSLDLPQNIVSQETSLQK